MNAFEPLEAPLVGPALPPSWRRYRDGFVVLQHLQALTCGSTSHGLHVLAMARHLGFTPEQAERVVDYLVLQGYLAYLRPGIEVVLTSEGGEYLAAGAGRRRSVRPRFATGRSLPPSARERGGRAPAPTWDPPSTRGGVLRWAIRLLERWVALPSCRVAAANPR